MECPRCNVEMEESPLFADTPVQRCPECEGIWVDVADLNRVLLHRDLPTLETLGGRVSLDEIAGQCPACRVDMIVVEGGEKRDPLRYETCEVCGGIWLLAEELDRPGREPGPVANAIIDFFRHFGGRQTVRP